MAGDEDCQKKADTQKMSPDEVKGAGVDGSKKPPGHNPGEFLHQRRKLPYSPVTMAIAGFLIVGAVGYFALYAKKKSEATGVAKSEDTRPRK